MTIRALADQTQRLAGRLGTTSVVLIVLAAAAPLTVLGGNVPLQIALGNGIGAPVGFLIALAVLLLFSVGFVAMTPHVRQPGAFFAYIETGLGRRPGWGTAFLALGTYSAVVLGTWGFFGASAADLVAHFGGPDLPWWFWVAVFLPIVGALGYRNVELSSRVLGLLLLAEIAIVVVFDAVVLLRGGAEGIAANSFALSNAVEGSLGITVLFAITAFIGFESTAVFRDEAMNPEVTIPRATYIAVLTIGIFYAVSSWLMIQGWGESEAVAAAQENPGGFMPNVLGTYLGGAGQDLGQILLVTSLFACLLAAHNVVARYQFNIANRGALPAMLGRTNNRHNAPSTSSLVQTVTSAVLLIVFALAGLDPLTQIFGWMAAIAVIGVQSLMLLTCASVLTFFARHPGAASTWSTRAAPALGLVGLLCCVGLVIANLPLLVGGTWALGFVLLAIPIAFLAFGFFLGDRIGARHAQDARRRA